MKNIIFLCLSLITIEQAFSQIQTINVGTSANDKTGDALRTAFQKTNSNFSYLNGLISDDVERLDSLIDAGGASSVWGDITGTLSDQTDLNSALGGKVPTTRTINSQPLSGDITLTKSNIGLSNIDNTSDANKPVSTAQQTAFDLKQNLLVNSAGLASSLSDESGTGTVVFSSITDGKQSTLTNSAGLAAALSDESGTGVSVFSTSPTLTTPNLGTPSAITLTSGTGLPISTGVSGLGVGVATALATPTSANIATAVTNETGTGSLVFSAGATLTGVTTLPSTTSIGTVSDAEIAFIDGLTSSAQTQLDAKVPSIRNVSGRALSADITTANLRSDLALMVQVSISQGAQTLTNQANTEQDFASVTQGTNLRFQVDATNYATVRLVAQVQTLSGSANSPRLFPQYSIDGGSNWITIGAGTVASGDALVLTSTGFKATNWITLPAGAKADVLFRAAQNGGDGTADPAISSISLQFKS